MREYSDNNVRMDYEVKKLVINWSKAGQKLAKAGQKWSKRVGGDGARVQRRQRADGLRGQKVVKRWSNTGQNLVKTGQTLFKTGW